MRNLFLILLLILFVPVCALANGHYRSGQIGVTPGGKVYGSVQFGSSRHRPPHFRPPPRYHHVRHVVRYGPERFYPVHRPVTWQVYPNPVVRQQVIYVQPQQAPAPQIIYVHPPEPKVRYTPGATATITHADGTKEIVYIEGAKVQQ